MSVNNHASSRLCSSVQMNARDEQRLAREKAGLRCRLGHLLRRTARVLELEGQSKFK